MSRFDSYKPPFLTSGGLKAAPATCAATHLRMWESLAIRQLGVLENVGSSPTILTFFEINSRTGNSSRRRPEKEAQPLEADAMKT